VDSQTIELKNSWAASAVHLTPGTLLHSALVYSHRATGSKNQVESLRRFYGYRGVSPGNWYGSGCGRVAANYFANTLTPFEVLCRHTVFGFYSLGTSEETARQWASELTAGRAMGCNRYTRVGDAATPQKGLRWCVDCARAELSTIGFATWRVVHQIPFIRICPTHRSILRTGRCRCKRSAIDCGAFMLPGEICSRCGLLETFQEEMPTAVAYQGLMDRAVVAFDQQLSIYLSAPIQL